MSKSSGDWKWSNGDSASYFNWGPLEPYENSGINDRAEIIVEAHSGPWTQKAGNWNNNSDLISPLGRYGIAEIPLSYFSISDTTFREGKGGDVTITRTGGTTTSQTLKIVSSDGSATLSDDDYAQVNKTVTFAAGETSKTINISTTADLNVESDESFSLTMTAEGSDDIPPQITDGSATVTIKADDFERGNSLYTIVDGPSWTQAETEAKRLGGNLVSIKTSEENTYLFANIVFTQSNHVWIGGSDQELEGSFKWSDNSPWSYVNWASGEPNNSSVNSVAIKGEDFAAFWLDGSGGWIDVRDKYYIEQGRLQMNGIAEIPLGGTPTYSITPSTSSIDEKSQSSVRFNISTTDVDANTRLYYTASGSGIDANDFSSGSIKSSRLIGSDGKATFVLSAAADTTTEGSESFNVKLYSDFQRTNLVATSSPVFIADTSKTPVKTPTYSISISPPAIDEGDSFRASIATTNVNAGTRLYYSIKGGVNSSDFSSSLTGSVAINANGNASVTRKALADKLTEGAETARILFYSDQQRTLQVGNTASLSISDTSKTPVKTPTYSLSISPPAIDEGDSFRASIATTNVNAGTRLYYSIKGGVNSSDFSSPLTGSVAINANGNASFTRKALADKLTEGAETARILFYSDQQRTLQVGNTASLSIRDTSTTAKKSTHNISFNRSSIKEGDILKTSLSSSNVDPGTRLYWAFSGNGIQNSDFSSGSLNGSSAIDKSGEFTLTHALKEDLTTEGTEQLTFKLFSDSGRKKLLTQKKLNISDTSTTQQSASLRSASVNASTLNLSFDAALDNTKPNHNRFSITADGKSIDISSSSLNAGAGTLKLNLASAIQPDQTVKLTYNDLNGNQSSGVLQTPNGTDLASFSTAVSNNSSDSTAPSITTATINGKNISLSFSERIAQLTPPNSSWTLKQDGNAISISSASVNSSSALLNLKLATAVDRNSNITLSYRDLAGDQKANVIQDLAGNDLASFSNRKLENQTTRSSDPLNINTAEIDGDEVVLAFDREINSTTPSKGTFRLAANNKAININRIFLYPNDREAVLKLASPVEHGDTVTLTYKDAQGNQTNNVIEDVDGNDLATITNFKLTNNTRKLAQNFKVDYANADGKIINLYLTDSLSSSIPKASKFRVTANNRRQKISSITTQPTEGVVTLNLKQSLKPKQDILISYRDLNGNQSAGVIEDPDGNDLASFNKLTPLNDSIDPTLSITPLTTIRQA